MFINHWRLASSSSPPRPAGRRSSGSLLSDNCSNNSKVHTPQIQFLGILYMFWGTWAPNHFHQFCLYDFSFSNLVSSYFSLSEVHLKTRIIVEKSHWFWNVFLIECIKIFVYKVFNFNCHRLCLLSALSTVFVSGGGGEGWECIWTLWPHLIKLLCWYPSNFFNWL